MKDANPNQLKMPPTLRGVTKNMRNMNKLALSKQKMKSRPSNKGTKRDSVESDVIEVDFDSLGLDDIDSKNKGKKVVINKKIMKESIKYPELEMIEEKDEPNSSERILGYGIFPPASPTQGRSQSELDSILQNIKGLQIKMIKTGRISKRSYGGLINYQLN